ncbi:MAG: O-antigen ligase family protein [Chitinophagaceae bacterium]|nr:O-antigen ligase family protein [Chitinophagaceae bacterium]
MKNLFLADTEGRNFKPADKIFYFLVLIFFAGLFIARAPIVPSIIMGALVILSFTSNSIKAKILLLKKRPYILLIILYYLLHIVSILWSDDKQEAASQLSIRLPLLLLPLAIGTMVISNEMRDRIIYAIVLITTVVALISLGLSFAKYAETGSTGYLYNDSLTVHFRLQSIYVAMLVNISIVGAVYLLAKRSATVDSPGLLYVAVSVLFGFHFLLASRSAMILLYGGLFIYAVYYIFKKRKYLEGATLVLGMLIGAFMLFKFFPKTVQRFKELTMFNYKYESKAAESHYDMKLEKEQWNGANTRLALWSCGWEVAKHNLFKGVGIGDRVLAVNEVYKERNFSMAIETKKNAHNSYLDALLTFGIAGLLMYVLSFVVLPFADVFKRADMFHAFVVTAFVVSMIFEVYLGRSIGCILTGFFYSFIAATKK